MLICLNSSYVIDVSSRYFYSVRLVKALHFSESSNCMKRKIDCILLFGLFDFFFHLFLLVGG